MNKPALDEDELKQYLVSLKNTALNAAMFGVAPKWPTNKITDGRSRARITRALKELGLLDSVNGREAVIAHKVLDEINGVKPDLLSLDKGSACFTRESGRDAIKGYYFDSLSFEQRKYLVTQPGDFIFYAYDTYNRELATVKAGDASSFKAITDKGGFASSVVVCSRELETREKERDRTAAVKCTLSQNLPWALHEIAGVPEDVAKTLVASDHPFAHGYCMSGDPAKWTDEAFNKIEADIVSEIQRLEDKHQALIRIVVAVRSAGGWQKLRELGEVRINEHLDKKDTEGDKGAA